jgi:hypothetical protein
MNYDHINKMQSYWESDVLPHLIQRINCLSFGEYIERFSRVSSGRWIRDLQSGGLNASRSFSNYDCGKYLQHFKNQCVTHFPSEKQEEGIHKFVHQMSATLHITSVAWFWIEREELQAHLSLFSFYNDFEEYKEFLKLIEPFKLAGDTGKPGSGGFGFNG